MRMMSLSSVVVISATLLATLPAIAASVPEYISADSSCAIVFEGLPQPDNEVSNERMKADQFWNRINVLLSEDLLAHLEDEHRVYRFENPYSAADQAFNNAVAELNERKCNSVIQLKHYVNQDNSGPYFEFAVTVMRARPSFNSGKYSGFTLPIVYEKRYRYVRTPQGIQEFMKSPISNFSIRAIKDIEEAGFLSGIKK